jgi:hypothetical protein
MIPMNSLIYKKDIIISNKINTDIEIENNYKSNGLIPYRYMSNYQKNLFKNKYQNGHLKISNKSV